MKRIVISLPVGETTLDLQQNLLLLLPDYTQILLLLPRSSFQAVSEELMKQPYGERTELVPFKTTYYEHLRSYLVFPDKDKIIYGDIEEGRMVPHGTYWVQDLFEVAEKPNGQKLLLISDTYKGYTSYSNKSDLKVVNDNTFIGSLSSGGVDIRKLELAFSGGNILVDELNGKRIVFCGGDMFRKTQTIWRGIQNTDAPTDSQIINILKEALNADEVVVIGREKVQPSLMFHLDQAMIPLPNGVVGITNVVGKQPVAQQAAKEIEEVEIFLLELRNILLQLGYKIVDIDTSVDNILNHQPYVNAIPYIDINTDQRTILMPVFPAAPFEKELEKKNTATFESLEYRVIPVFSKAFEINGGVHCLINVLE